MSSNEAIWIWVEPIGFDNTLPDYGVKYYLRRADIPIKGVSLLMSHLDFIMLHEGMETERVLWPDACSRLAHEMNQERERQEWTTWQIRGLVDEFHRHGVQVFVSFFRNYLHNQWHREWSSDHEAGTEWLAVYDDGTAFEDIFVPQLKQVVLDYHFDGWHAADAECPAGCISKHLCSDHFVRDFLRNFPHPELDAGILDHCDGNPEREQLRNAYLWEHCRLELMQYTTQRWETITSRAAEALHSCGRKLMVNSCCTKSVLESTYQFGLDTRRLPACGVDIFVVETVAPSLHLVSGVEYPVFTMSASLGELKAVLPGVELILLTGVWDVVESFDAFRHAPERLFRDTFVLANQAYVENGELGRCASGFMICLGDIAFPEHWQMLKRMHEDNWGFDIAATGGLTVVYEPAMFDQLLLDHDRYGVVPPYLQTGALMRHGVEVHTACPLSELDRLGTRPVLVPEATSLPQEMWQKLLRREGITVLTGNVAGVELPENAVVMTVKITDGYCYGCVIVGTGTASRTEIPQDADAKPFNSFDTFELVHDQIPMMHIPEAFWRAAAAAVDAAIRPADTGLAFRDGDLFVLDQTDGGGTRRVAFCSDVERYAEPEFHFAAPYPCGIRNLHNFPCYPLEVSPQDGRLKCRGINGHVYGRLHVPPKGILIVDCK